MSARVPPVVAKGLTAVCIVLLYSGCAGLRQHSAEPEVALGESDRGLAKALAHYAQGLIYEREYGYDSRHAIEHFAQAARAADEVGITAQHRAHRCAKPL